MIAPWKGIPPCPHAQQYMPNSPQCVRCWLARHADAEILMPVAETLARLEALPFEAGEEEAEGDYSPSSVMAGNV